MSHHTLEELQEKATIELQKLLDREEPLKPKERTKIEAQEMPQQDPVERRANLEEVALGYTPEQARLEAMRCLQCPKEQCIADCPVAINIPKFVGHIAEGDFQAAADEIKKVSLLPSICGRVCPQRNPMSIELHSR
ncbi:MAG: hypothetical protein U5K00_14510 [Melioribacteraceae bacterium]|nr:hypothetical protein [Melioribacteraceae bacterium]